MTNDKKRLLVVDDALFMRKLICGVAAEAGWEVVGEAGNGLEAIALYDQLRPDLVTMDLVMPEMGGLEALRHLSQGSDLWFRAASEVVIARPTITTTEPL